MGIKSRKSYLAGASLLIGVLASANAPAVPMLQLYIEGASYDATTQSWYYAGHDFTLWVIGNLTGPGGSGGLPISNVRLAAVYDDPGSAVTITLTPTRIGDGTGLYSGFIDPSTPSAPGAPTIVTDGSVPLIGGTHYLPDHSQYGAGKIWQEFALGDFTTPDSQLANFVNSFPVLGPNAGFDAQINAYKVHVDGADAHFDTYGQIQNSRGRIYVFAPPSHDATDGPARVPVPATLALLGIGALGLGAARRKSR